MKITVSPFFLFAILFISVGCSVQVITTHSPDGGVYRSEDSGVTWQQKVFVKKEKNRTVTLGGVDVTGIYKDPQDENGFTLTTSANGMYQSHDRGETWQPTVFTSGAVSAFAYDPSNSGTQYVGTGRLIYKRTSSDTQWHIIYTDSQNQQISAIAIDPSNGAVIFAGTGGGSFVLSGNSGADWRLVTNFQEGIRSISIDLTTASRMFVVTNAGKLERSTDHGSTWQVLDSLSKIGAGTLYQLLLVRGSGNNLYLGSQYGLLHSDDAGDTWTVVKTLVTQNSIPIRTVAVDTHTNTLYFSVSNFLHSSTDGGATWRTVVLPTGRTVVRLLDDPVHAGQLYAGTYKIKK